MQLSARGQLSAEAPFVAPGGEARLVVEGRGLRYGEPIDTGAFRLAASTDEPAWPLGRLQAELSVERPWAGIDRVETSLRVADGTLWIEGGKIGVGGKPASLRASVPLGSLVDVVDGLDGLVAEPTAGPIDVAVSGVDLPTALRLAPEVANMPEIRGVAEASVRFDPADPLAAEGSITISGFGIDVPDASLETAEPLRIEIADGRVELPRTRLRSTSPLIRGDLPFEIAARAEIARDWEAGDDPLTLLGGLTATLDGTVDGALLNPYLAGGAAEGDIVLAVAVQGNAEEWSADARIRGPEASVFYRRPYPTRIESPEVDLVVRDGQVQIDSVRGRLNSGSFEMTGVFDPDEGLDAQLQLDGSRYRLDFGITTSIGGSVRVEWPLEGRRRISGDMVVERAVLRRSITLNREVLDTVLRVDSGAGANPILDTIDLDLGVTTDDGVLIRNNVADVHADWGRVHIGGTAAAPELDGRVDVRPGGIVTALGIVYRIDEASLEWDGTPSRRPSRAGSSRWTSHLDDPTVIQSWRNEFFTPADLGPGRGGILDFRNQAWAGYGNDGAGAGPAVATGLAAQATSSTRTQLSYEPLPLFGETDVQARYTLSQDLSPQLSFIASTNPREAEAQTYILDMHRLPVLPTFRAQLFTNDRKNTGFTLQHTMKLGKAPRSDPTEPLLGSKTIDVPEGISRRRLKRSIGYRKADPFPEGAALDAEVDVIDALRMKGYPSAQVEVEVEPRRSGPRRVDLLVHVDPGEPVRFVFEGDKLPAPARRSVRAAYRPLELGERLSLEDVQNEAGRALLEMGYLEPRVDVESIPPDPADPESVRTVQVGVEGGRRVELSELNSDGLPAEEAAYLAERVGSTLQRVELALGRADADAVLLAILRDRGYPEARITDRSVSEDGDELRVSIDPGRRQRLASIELDGLTAADRERLSELLGTAPGDPLILEHVGRDARAIERDLRDRGHADARVTARVAPADESRPHEVALRYEVDPGPLYGIEEVRIEGLGKSRRKWVEGWPIWSPARSSVRTTSPRPVRDSTGPGSSSAYGCRPRTTRRRRTRSSSSRSRRRSAGVWPTEPAGRTAAAPAWSSTC